LRSGAHDEKLIGIDYVGYRIGVASVIATVAIDQAPSAFRTRSRASAATSSSFLPGAQRIWRTPGHRQCRDFVRIDAKGPAQCPDVNCGALYQGGARVINEQQLAAQIWRYS
jgi:hypothetical protein